MGIVSQKLRDSAKGMDCTFETEFCNYDRSTVVLCHLPSDVKGMGNKSHDFNAAFGCSDCHAAIDQHRIPHAPFYMLRGLQRTQAIWRDRGLIVIAGDNEKPRKPSSKIMPRRPLALEAKP